LYTANMFKVMTSGVLQMQADLALAGHPNKFQSKPVAIKLDWDLLQGMAHRTLLCTHCHAGYPHAWQRCIAAIYGDEVHDRTRALCCSALNTALVSHIQPRQAQPCPRPGLGRALLKFTGFGAHAKSKSCTSLHTFSAICSHYPPFNSMARSRMLFANIHHYIRRSDSLEIIPCRRKRLISSSLCVAQFRAGALRTAASCTYCDSWRIFSFNPLHFAIIDPHSLFLFHDSFPHIVC
jgi:hypothetical protein